MIIDYSVLLNRNILDILIGDTKVYGQYSMPYYSGSALQSLCLQFGLSTSSQRNNGLSKSRWVYMQELIAYLNKKGDVQPLLNYLFSFERFSELLRESKRLKDDYRYIIQGAINAMNNILKFSNTKIAIINNNAQLVKSDEEVVIKSDMGKMITYEYIAQLPERIKQDLENNDYDSVITKSRTLLEEVFIYIIEKTTNERYKSNGKLISIHSEVQDILGMKPNKDWDHRVSDLLNGINKTVASISDMRNMNSDAHGVGTSRLAIKNREARLVANSAMSIAEYYLSVFLKERL